MTKANEDEKLKTALSQSAVEGMVIKTCPFCGENPRIFKWKTGWIVQCENEECGVRPETNEMDNLAEAEVLWNGRVL